MNSLKEYGELFQKLNLTELSVTEGDFSLCMKKEVNLGAMTQVSPTAAPIQEAVAFWQEGTRDPMQENIEQIQAPLLGIVSLGTENRPMITVGDRVSKGDVLCHIEAMKMLNEVTAPIDGVIREICVKDGELVEYHQPLFLLEK